MDLLKSLGSLLFTGLGIVCFIAGILNDAILLGLIGGGVCLFISFKILNSVSSETWKAVQDAEKRENEKKMNGGYKCPNCGMHAGHKINTVNKAVSVSVLGLASDKIGKTYKCENCGYMW